MEYKNHKISEYHYELPNEKIAKYPLPNRADSKLLVFKDKKIQENRFSQISDFFDSSDLLVFNNTKVIQARLFFRKETGSNIEIFCLEPFQPAEYSQSFQASSECSWKCIVGNSKKWKKGKLELILNDKTKNTILTAERISQTGETQIIEFHWDNPRFSFADILETFGRTPIPPYLNRKSEESDKSRYQTVYSKFDGSVAAPTAGLHFTTDILENLKIKNIRTSEITLHVGAGTFKPMKSATSDLHEMHTEHFSIDKENLKLISKSGGNITAIGTTTVRSLESIYWIGVKLILHLENPFHISQKEVYDFPTHFKPTEALQAVETEMNKQILEQIWASTQIMIVPGYEFKMVNKLVTNFHQPQSTLLLLVAAFTKDDNWIKIYNYALQNDFRFLSYGDSSLLIST